MLLHLAGVRQIKLDTLFVPSQSGVQVKTFISDFIGAAEFQIQTKYYWGNQGNQYRYILVTDKRNFQKHISGN